MGVVLHYAGSRFELDGYTASEACERIQNVANRIEVETADPEFGLRTDSDDTVDIQPWIAFNLVGGWTVRVWAYDPLQLAIEDTEGTEKVEAHRI